MCSRCCICASVCWPQDQPMPSPSTWTCAQNHISATAQHFIPDFQLHGYGELRAAVWLLTCVHSEFISATGCLLTGLHAHCKKCSGYIVRHAGRLTSRKTAPAFFLLSFCQCEGCYGCCTKILLSMISGKLSTTTKHTHTPKHKWLELTHRNCTLTFALIHVCRHLCEDKITKST